MLESRRPLPLRALSSSNSAEFPDLDDQGLLWKSSFSSMRKASVSSTGYRVVAHRLERDYLPDANLSKAAWQGASRVTLVDTENPQRPHPGAKTEASVRWSSEYLYVAFWCQY